MAVVSAASKAVRNVGISSSAKRSSSINAESSIGPVSVKLKGSVGIPFAVTELTTTQSTSVLETIGSALVNRTRAPEEKNVLDTSIPVAPAIVGPKKPVSLDRLRGCVCQNTSPVRKSVGFEFFRLWKHGEYELGAGPLVVALVGTEYTLTGGSDPDKTTGLVDLIVTTLDPSATGTGSILEAITNPTGAGSPIAEDSILAFNGMIIYDANLEVRKFYKFRQVTTTTGVIERTTDFDSKTGRSFELDIITDPTQENPLFFKWNHFAPRSNRIDPSISNVIDILLLTNAYNSEVLTWKGSNDITLPFPTRPTTEDLRIQFSELNEFKMLSDQIIFKPGKFKLLFGTGAQEELRATFKVVKVADSTVTDNEVKSQIITAIDQYFDISLWDFGESFFYTELSAFLHQQLAKTIASVVIVPTKDESVFGNLFQVKGEPDELFLSTATVADIEIVRNLTDTNLRISSST